MYKINNNYCKTKQYNEEHQYHNFFHATLCIVNINMASLNTSFFNLKNNKNTKYYKKKTKKNNLFDIFTRGNSLLKLINK